MIVVVCGDALWLTASLSDSGTSRPNCRLIETRVPSSTGAVLHKILLTQYCELL